MSNDDLPPDSPDEPPPGAEPETTFQDVLDHYKDLAENTTQKGTYFERLIVAFLRTDPYYADLFDKVELIGDSKFAEEHNLTSGVGVDIIATERETGEHWAIQAKFRENVLTVAELATFFLIAGKSCFSRSMIASASDVNDRVIGAMAGQTNPCSILGRDELEISPIIWGDLKKSLDTPPSRHAKKSLRKHQVEAVEAVVEGFKTADRGKLIMACGTGKTFTALKLAERIVPKGGSVLVLTPSISLISQTLHEWYNDKEVPMRGAAVCSDGNVRRSGEGSGEPLQYEVGFPVTTKPATIAGFLKKKTQKGNPDSLSVVYCTYQSLEVIHHAQKMEGVPKFDLIICDEAHRTAGRKDKGADEASLFARVHNAEYVKADKRLYMTATPKSYTRAAQTRADEKNLALYSMDDEKLYGKEFYRLAFSEALKRGLLSDYKVIVLGIRNIPKEDFFNIRKDGEEYKITGTEEREELTRVLGCFGALSKQKLYEEGVPIEWEDSTPMKRAVAFSNEIKESERFRAHVKAIQEKQEYDHFSVDVRHVDGTMNARKRNRDIAWLKNGNDRKNIEPDASACYILTNARCLSEGVDVPALDAILFLKRRKAQIDVIQSVGRVMRLAEGKKMGYVIIPITVREGGSQELALHKNRQYKEVWDVLQALRSHDDAIDVEINQMYLPREEETSEEEKKKANEETNNGTEDDPGKKKEKKIILAVDDDDVEFALRFQESLRADIVKNCGDRNYFRNWAKDVGEIARAYTGRIGKALSDKESKEYKEFEKFLQSLQGTLNPNISEQDAIEMLAQHLVARPVFDALFKDYAFAKRNPVSQAMQRMIDLLANSEMLEKNQKLEEFYEDVKIKVAGIQDIRKRQEVIRDLYETFFKSAFPKLAARVGLVYTPLTVVDFILHSVNDISQREFGRNLAAEDVHILDPFTGMGTFITRLMQNQLIPDKKDLERKFMGHGAHGEYTGEIHANELVLLAYYIATINIEEVYHSLSGDRDYQSFRGAVLTDTFRLRADTKDSEKIKTNDSISPPLPQPQAQDFFAQIAGSTKVQNKRPIHVIVGNPPYFIGQKSENDANQNQKYEDHLDERIRKTYAKHSTAVTLRTLYDSCNRALRWASDRIGTDPGDEGIISFVTNGSFIDGDATAGLRHCLMQEFSHVYCFDLRGNTRLSGEIVRREGGKIFGGNSRVPVVILILVKKANHKAPGALHYHDIGDYLTREAKLAIIAEFGSVGSQNIPWEEITPDKYYDWINQRSEILYQFIPMGIKETRGEATTKSIFTDYSQGIVSSRDAWVYNFSRDKVLNKMQSMIAEYNQQVQKMEENPNSKINNDAKQINWSRSLKARLRSKRRLPTLDKQRMALSQYRPFAKRYLYYERNCLEVIYQQAKLFPIPEAKNKVICVSGMGASKDFSVLMIGSVPEYATVEVGQCFPLYTWEKGQSENLIHSQLESSRNENITDYAFSLFREAYPGIPITKEDIFYYVYGILHSPEYIERFAKDLKKIFVRIPLAKDFAQFRDAGRQLGDLHLNYETAEPCNKVSVKLDGALTDDSTYRVEKMKFGKDRVERKLVKDTSIIHYNEHITLEGIPPEAYNYQINGRSAIEWIIDQYQVQTNKESGIVNDPNDWAREHDNPRYILDLLLRVITVSLGTMKIINSLPTKDSFREDPATLNLIKTFAPPSRSRP